MSMNDIIKTDLKENIVNLLLCGENPNTIAIKCKCDLNTVLLIMGSTNFLEKCTELVEKSIKSQVLSSIRNITLIANSKTASDVTRLKANQYIVDRSLEFNDNGHDTGEAATMTQEQLAARVKDLQNEVNKRAKPIDTGVIDMSLDDML